MQKYNSKNDRIKAFSEIMSGGFQPVHCEHLAHLLDDMGFFDAPASTKYHGVFSGGLYEHSENVTLNLLNLTEKLGLEWGKPRSPYLIGMLHDLCKCDLYLKQPDGSFLYRENRPLTGHGDKSVILAQQIADLTEEEVLCIRWHMGAYDDAKNWSAIGVAIERYPNVLYTHTADMIASRIHGI